ncbi:hypothetical protein BDQ17DRAFT_1345733 [Cyathus striatus]|nr:hypothetical protein BDQ17DRAFT_1345733 [Cyathus striatus]
MDIDWTYLGGNAVSVSDTLHNTAGTTAIYTLLSSVETITKASTALPYYVFLQFRSLDPLESLGQRYKDSSHSLSRSLFMYIRRAVLNPGDHSFAATVIEQNKLSSTQLILFNTLSAAAMLLNALAIGTVIYGKIKRSRSWFAQLYACFIYSFSLLLIVGRQMGPEPPFGLCFLQAATVYAGTAFVAYSFACLVVEFYLQLLAVLNHRVFPRFWITLLVLSPWAIFGFIFILSMLAVSHSSGVERDAVSHAYCHVASTEIPSYVTAAIVMASALVGLIVEVKVGILLHRNWTAFKCASSTNPMISWSLFMRICSYTFAATLAEALSIFILTHDIDSNSLGVWRILLPLVPGFGAIAFGTQRDIMGKKVINMASVAESQSSPLQARVTAISPAGK